MSAPADVPAPAYPSAPASTPMIEAETRMLRLILFTLGLASVVAVLSVVQNAIAQLPYLQVWWSTLAFIAAVALPIAGAIASRRASRRTLRLIAAVMSIVFLLALITLVFGLTSGTLAPSVNAPWILGITPIGTISVALAASPLIAWSYCVVAAAFVFIDRVIAFPGQITEVAAQDAIVALLVEVVFTALVLVSLATARTLDRVAYLTQLDKTETAVTAARQRERMHASALVHDHVLATLLLASRDTGTFREALAHEARKSLDAIERFGEPPLQFDVTADDLISRLQSTTSDLAPFADFDVDAAATSATMADARFPPELAEAIGEATAEALRNSIRHAGGSEVNRAVRVEIDTSSLRVLILDDGAGFDPSTVAEGRLGIGVSIVARLTALVGGYAEINSRPGAGTAVVVGWNARAES